MPVAVDCSVRPSRIRWLIVLSIVAIASAFFLSLSILPWLAAISVVFFWFAHLIWQSELVCDHLSFRGADVLLSSADVVLPYLWRGDAVCSFAFVRLRLFNDLEEQGVLTIWKDSISDDHWRAFNMAVRVHETQAKNQQN